MNAGCGRTLPDLWASYDRATRCWKMSQGCLPFQEDTSSVRSSVTWPRSGMTVNGTCFQQPSSGHSTYVTDSGSSVKDRTLWPTPGANDWKGSAQWGQRRRQLDERVENQERDRSRRWPTPTSSDASGSGNRNIKGSHAHAGVSLTDACLSGDSSTPRSVVTGTLNPTWVEWLMGFPSGWTDCGH